jgi:hypothetical protein
VVVDELDAARRADQLPVFGLMVRIVGG